MDGCLSVPSMEVQQEAAGRTKLLEARQLSQLTQQVSDYLGAQHSPVSSCGRDPDQLYKRWAAYKTGILSRPLFFPPPPILCVLKYLVVRFHDVCELLSNGTESKQMLTVCGSRWKGQVFTVLFFKILHRFEVIQIKIEKEGGKGILVMYIHSLWFSSAS